MINASAIFETVLYADPLSDSAYFYRDVFGLRLLQIDTLMAVLRIDSQMLLLFNPELSQQPNRLVPSHGCVGEGHIAFGMKPEETDTWREKLKRLKIEIEKEVTWGSPNPGTSIYVRDPAGNSVELAPIGLWDYLSKKE